MTFFLNLKSLLVRFGMLDSGASARQNKSGEKVSPWNIPVSILISSSSIVPLECGRQILVIHFGIEYLMKLATVGSMLYK